MKNNKIVNLVTARDTESIYDGRYTYYTGIGKISMKSAMDLCKYVGNVKRQYGCLNLSRCQMRANIHSPYFGGNNTFTLCVDGITESRCFTRGEFSNELDTCLVNMADGICTCEQSRKIAAILWPEKYQGR